VPQETAPFAWIMATLGVTPLQMVKASEVGTHTDPMFTMPVAVTGPQVDGQVMVYSQ
jgi:hypothetical protein